QDNEIAWLNWDGIGDEGAAMTRFTQALIALRQRFPILRHERFLHGQRQDADGVKDITWFAPAGEEMTESHWQDPNARCAGLMLNGRAAGPEDDGALLLVLLNANAEAVPFALPEPLSGKGWRKLIDTEDAESEGG